MIAKSPASTLVRKLAVLAIIASLLAPLATVTTAYADVSRVDVSTSVPNGKPLFIDVDVPAGAQAGNLLVVQIVARSMSSTDKICPPTGWVSRTKSSEDSNVTSEIFTKFATDSEPSSYRWHFKESSGVCNGTTSNGVDRAALGGMIAYSGVDPTTPIVGAASKDGSGTALTTPVIANVPAGSHVLHFYASDKNQALPLPGGHTTIYALQGGGDDRSSRASEITQAVTGNTGNAAITAPESSNWVGQTLALGEALEPSGPTQLAITSTAHDAAVNDCLAIVIESQDSGGNATVVDADTLVSLATDQPGEFYATADCDGTPITSATIGAGQSTVTVYYKPTAVGSGSHEITVDANDLDPDSQVQTIGKATQAPVVLDQPTSMTYGDAAVTLVATGGSGTGAYSYSSGSSTGCSVTGDQLTVIDASGTCEITATRAGDDDYQEATSAPHTVTLNKATPDFTFDLSSLNKSFGDADFSVASDATTNSTGAVTFALGSGSVGCTVTSDGTVTITGAGACIIEASLAADSNYSAAGPLSQSFTIGKANQATLVLDQPVSMTYGDAPYTLVATGGSGTGAVTYSAGLSTGCEIQNGNELIVTNASGTCVITATKAGDDDYQEATSAPHTVTLNKAAGSIGINNLPSNPQVGDTFTPTFDQVGEGTPYVVSLTPEVCTVDAITGEVTFIAEGECILEPRLEGNDNYESITGQQAVFAIAAAPVPAGTIQACLFAGSLSQVREVPESGPVALNCGRGEMIVFYQGTDLQACLYAGALSQVGYSTLTPLNCGRGYQIGIATGTDLWACMFSGSLSQVGYSQPNCTRGVRIGLMLANQIN